MAARVRARRVPGLEIFRKWHPDWRHALRSRHVPADPIARVAFRFARVQGAFHYKMQRELYVLANRDLKRAVSAMSAEDIEQARFELQDLRIDLEITQTVVDLLVKHLPAARKVGRRQRRLEVLDGGRA